MAIYIDVSDINGHFLSFVKSICRNQISSGRAQRSQTSTEARVSVLLMLTIFVLLLLADALPK